MSQVSRINWYLTPFSVRTAWLIAGGFLLVNFLLKFPFLTANDIALDEPFTLFYANYSLGDLWEFFKTENSPPLHYVFSHFWNGMFGLEPAVVRLPYLLFSCLTAGVIFRIGNRHFGGWTGIFAAGLFTLSTENIFYSHEARTYALFILLTALSVNSFLQFLENPEKNRTLIWLAIWNALLIYCHFLGVFLLLMQGILGLQLLWKGRKPFFRLLFSYALTAVLYGPGIYLILIRLGEVSEVGTWVQKPGLSAIYGNLAMMFNSGWSLAGIGILLLVTVGLNPSKLRSLLTGQEGGPTRALVTWFAGTFAGLFVFSFLFTPVFIPRYLIFLSPLAYLSVAAVLQLFLKEKFWWIGILGWISVGVMINLNPSNHRAVAETVHYVESFKTAETPVFICPNTFDKTYMYHLDRGLFGESTTAFAKFFERNYHAVSAWSDVEAQLQPGFPRIIFLDAGASAIYPDNGILEGLTQKFEQPKSAQFPEIFTVYIWEISPVKDN